MIILPVSRLIQEYDARSFTVIGSPGSDGLGTEALQIYADAIANAEGDFIVTLGDIAPLGRDAYYKQVSDFVDRIASKPMHVAPGNHDGAAFSDYFGFTNRAILSADFVLLMLDNSEGRFSDETLSFLRDTLAIVDSANIVVAFHIPPPNRISGDTLSAAEWSRFEEAVGVWRKRISLLVCGHAHTYYEDDIDGIRLIVTGGGGAHIESMDRVARPSHHVVEFKVDDEGVLSTRVHELSPGGHPGREPEVLQSLKDTFAAECHAHVRHIMAAETAEGQGLVNLARLFRTAAASRLRHARNLHIVLESTVDPREAVRESLETARRESDEKRSDLIAAADMARDPLAAKALTGVMASEKNHASLFAKAREEMAAGGDIVQTRYHVCGSCGLVVAGGDAPDNCPECGAPADLFRESL